MRMDINIDQEPQEYKFFDYLLDKEYFGGLKGAYLYSRLIRCLFITNFYAEYEDYCKINGFIYENKLEIEQGEEKC